MFLQEVKEKALYQTNTLIHQRPDSLLFIIYRVRSWSHNEPLDRLTTTSISRPRFCHSSMVFFVWKKWNNQNSFRFHVSNLTRDSTKFQGFASKNRPRLAFIHRHRNSEKFRNLQTRFISLRAQTEGENEKHWIEDSPGT